MGTSLESFCADAKAILKADPGADGRAAVAEKLKELLVDRDFVAAYFDADKGAPQRVVYRDPELGFNVLVHHHKAGREGPPHDHGESWAIYGVAKGCTVMTEWRRLDDGSKPGHAEIEPERTYRLEVGMTAPYGPRVIHNTHHPDGAWVVRVTGGDLDTIPRRRFLPDSKEVREIRRAVA